MDVAAATLILVPGIVMLGIGLYARVNNVALGGVANTLAAFVLFRQNGLELQHFMALAALLAVVFPILKSFNQEMWRKLRVVAWLSLGIIVNMWTLVLLETRAPRGVQLGLLGLLAILTAAWIGLILVGITKDPFASRYFPMASRHRGD